MKNLILTVLTIFVLTENVKGQELEHEGFKLEEGAVYWQKVYDADGSNLMASLKLNRYVEVVEEKNMIVDVKDYVFEKNGYNCSGRATIELKDNKYRVTVRDISYKPGAMGNALATGLMGGNPDFVFTANNDFVKRGGLTTKNKIMRLMNEGLEQLFVVVEEKKDDW